MLTYKLNKSVATHFLMKIIVIMQQQKIYTKEVNKLKELPKTLKFIKCFKIIFCFVS